MASLPQWLTVTNEPAPAVIDGRSSRTRAAFFTEAARALRFPDYFGHNWDAFADCLRDLDRPALLIAHAEELLMAEAPGQLAILLRILAEAAEDGLTLTLSTPEETALRTRIETALA